MKKIIFIACFLACIQTFAQQEDADAKDFVQTTLNGFFHQDEALLNGFIHPENGFYVLRSVGSYTHWYKALHSICFTSKCLAAHPDRSIGEHSDKLIDFDFSGVKALPIFFSNNPYFECEEIKKQGVFISDLNFGNLLSEAMEFLIQENMVDIPKTRKDLVHAQKFEKQSRRVIINTSKETLIFYITQWEGQWYIGMLDFASTDCSV